MAAVLIMLTSLKGVDISYRVFYRCFVHNMTIYFRSTLNRTYREHRILGVEVGTNSDEIQLKVLLSS